MGSKKLRPFAEILILEKELSPDQRLDLLDVLRGRPQRAERKPRAAKPAKETKPKMCAICHQPEEHFDHDAAQDGYHLFRTEVKKKDKAAGASQ